MTVKELLDVQMLAATMHAMASKLEAAVKILKAAEAAGKLIDQVRGLAVAVEPQCSERTSDLAGDRGRRRSEVAATGVVRPAGVQPSARVAASPAAGAAVGRASAIAAVREFRPAAQRVGVASGAAVFDHDTVRRTEFAKDTAEGNCPF